MTSSSNSHATKHIFAGGQRIATKLLPAATVVTNMPPGNTPGGGWPNTNGCIPSGNQPQKCVETTPGSGVWVQQGNIRPATWYFHSDMLGSTGWLTTDDGEVHERVEYFPYGEAWRQSNGSGTQRLHQQFLYTGKEFDEETGLTYFGARYYDSRHARWLSVDPKNDNESFVPLRMSKYLYAFGAPLNFLDPDGRDPVIVVGPNLLHRMTVSGSDGGAADVRIGDIRQAKDFQGRVIDFVRREFPGLKDITSKTPVVSVDNAKEFKRAIDKSGKSGSKVYVGHFAYQKSPTGGVTGKGPLLDKVMTNEELREALKGVTGDVAMAGCASGTLKTDTPLELKGSYLGFPTIGEIMIGADAPPAVRDSILKNPSALENAPLDTRNLTVTGIVFVPQTKD